MYLIMTPLCVRLTRGFLKSGVLENICEAGVLENIFYKKFQF